MEDLLIYFGRSFLELLSIIESKGDPAMIRGQVFGLVGYHQAGICSYLSSCIITKPNPILHSFSLQ